MDLFSQPLNQQDADHLGAILEKLELDKRPVEIDVKPSPFRPLHPTLKKCYCGMIGSKLEFYDHMDVESEKIGRDYSDAKEFWSQHGEVPYYGE